MVVREGWVGPEEVWDGAGGRGILCAAWEIEARDEKQVTRRDPLRNVIDLIDKRGASRRMAALFNPSTSLPNPYSPIHPVPLSRPQSPNYLLINPSLFLTDSIRTRPST
jgi:hypothetical protein